MRTIQQIKNLVAQEHDFENWKEVLQKVADLDTLDKLIDIAISNYADEKEEALRTEVYKLINNLNATI